MSAPDYLYKPYRALKAVNSNNVLKIVSTTSSSASSAVLRDRFYLDFFVNMCDKSSGTEVWSWAGACYVGSENYYMHNTARHGWIRQKDSSGREYVVFWDAGLNTLGKVNNLPQLVNPVMTSFTVSANYKSAWYVDSRCRMEYRIWNNSTNDWGGWIDFDLVLKPQQFEGEINFSTQFENLTPEIRQHGIQFRGRIENDEGVNQGGASIAYFPTGVPITFVQPSITLYMTTSEVIPAIGGQGEAPTVLFQDSALTTEWTTVGVELYLVYSTTYKKWLTYGYSSAFGYNCVLEIKEQTTPPPSSPPYYDYQGYNMYDQNDAEQQVIMNTGSNIGRFYIDENNNTAHASFGGTYPNWTFGPKRAVGYYASGQPMVVQQVMYVDGNGVISEVDPIN